MSLPTTLGGVTLCHPSLGAFMLLQAPSFLASPLSPPSLHPIPLAEVCQSLVPTYKIQTLCGDLQELVQPDPLLSHTAQIYQFPF